MSKGALFMMAAAETPAPPIGGNLYVWGRNDYGQFGNGATSGSTRLTPLQVDLSFGNCGGVIASGKFSLLLCGGLLYSCGLNDHGQLGQGDTTDRNEFTQVGSGTDWGTVSSRWNSVLGTHAGELFGWGFNDYAQLGLGDTTERTSPTQVGSGTDWELVSCGRYHSLATTIAPGNYRAVGYNAVGNLVIGDTTDRTTWADLTVLVTDPAYTAYVHASPLAAEGAYPFSAIGAYDVTDELTITGGAGNNGRLANGSTSDDIDGYELAAGFSQMSLGPGFGMGIRDGALYGWGRNDYGQLGLGDTTQRTSPVQVGVGTDWYLVSCGGTLGTALAIKTDGTLWAAGYNQGMFGNGGTSNSTTFTQVGTDTDWDQVSVGYDHVLALKVA